MEASAWDQVGAFSYRRRYAALDLNVGAIIGEDGVLVVDSRESAAAAEELTVDLATLTAKPVRWLVNTHWHWDHVWGNSKFPGTELWGHRRCREVLLTEGAQQRDTIAAADWVSDEDRESIRNTVIVAPDNVVETSTTIDIGTAAVELRHFGLAHTDSDLAVIAGDVVFAGDMLEEGAPPQFNDGYPLAWPETVGLLRTYTADVGQVIPGHGDVMDQTMVADQHALLHAIATWASQMCAGRSAESFDLDDGPLPAAQLSLVLQRANLEMNR